MHMATLPIGIIYHIKIPLNTVKLTTYRKNELSTLIHSVKDTYHPDKTEAINFHFQTMIKSNSACEVNYIDLYKTPMVSNTICDVRTFQKLAPRFLLPLPYCQKKINFLKEYHFQFSDPYDSNWIQLCEVFVKKRNCATHRHDVKKVPTTIRIRMELDAKLPTHRPIKTPTPCREKTQCFTGWLAKKCNYPTKWFNASSKTKEWNQLSESIDHHKKEWFF